MTLDVVIEGVGVWSAELPGWEAARAVLRGEREPGVGAVRPAPALLAANERRRAPESVLLALDVAQQACAMSGRDAATLPAVFASAYGDLAINDYLCAELTRAPHELSPTKFHNSVHNAPAGYWAIATGCMASTSAISAAAATFGAGLLEAALLATGEKVPVTYAAYDIAASGPLADVVPCRSAFALGLVLAPRRERPGAALRLRLAAAPAAHLAPEPAVLHAAHRDNPAAYGSPLLKMLANAESGILRVPAGPRLDLILEVSTWQN